MLTSDPGLQVPASASLKHGPLRVPRPVVPLSPASFHSWDPSSPPTRLSPLGWHPGPKTKLTKKINSSSHS